MTEVSLFRFPLFFGGLMVHFARPDTKLPSATILHQDFYIDG